jgi:ubiquinone/menaquinone biosynthesis C-methylase UbiE
MHHNAAVAFLALLVFSFEFGCGSLKRFAYEGFGRARWQNPDEVVRVLGIKPGETVADLGAGGGYFAFRLARAVGPTGKVYAVDVDPAMVDYLRARANQEGFKNIEVALASENDPRLPTAQVDLVFTCNTYHHLTQRPTYFARLKQYLRPDGRIAIIDYSGGTGFLARIFGHSTPNAVVRDEMNAAGYSLEAAFDILPRQTFLVFADVVDQRNVYSPESIVGPR